VGHEVRRRVALPVLALVQDDLDPDAALVRLHERLGHRRRGERVSLDQDGLSGAAQGFHDGLGGAALNMGASRASLEPGGPPRNWWRRVLPNRSD
jgi:hypothetical protein